MCAETAFCTHARTCPLAAQADGTGTITYQAQYEAFGTRTQEFGSDQDRQRANTKEEEEDPTGLRRSAVWLLF